MNAILPFVRIIVTAYLPKSKPYLDLCLRSIENLDYPKERYEVVVVSPKGYVPTDKYRVVHPDKDAYWNSHALNFGASGSSASYFLMLNDDVVLTTQSLRNLVYASSMINDRSVLMSLSNDQQGKYVLCTPAGSGPYKIEQIKDADALMNTSSPYRDYGVFFYETLCLYAFLVPRALWNDVGGFDESLRGGDDVDFSLRVREKGYLNGIALDSLIYHAGGVSADKTLTPQMRADDLIQFEKKWGFRPRWNLV